jgi:hypothetical protein
MRTRPFVGAMLLSTAALLACDPGPNITEVHPTDGAFVPGEIVAVTGKYVGVAPADALVTINGEPAAVSGDTYALDVSIAPGATSLLVELRDASDETVRMRQQVAVIRGDTLPPGAFAEDAAALRLNESFFEALPTREIAEAALDGFVASNEFFQDGLGSDLVDCLLSAAGSVEVDFTAEPDFGLNLTTYPDCPELEGQHTFDLPLGGSVTCRVRASLGGSAFVEGDLEPDPAASHQLDFEGLADAAFDFDYDVDDPGGNGLCDLPFPEFDALLASLLSFYSGQVLPQVAAAAADAVSIEMEPRFCPLPGGCTPAEERGFRIKGALEAVDEVEGAAQLRADARSEPLFGDATQSLRVSDAVPVFGPTTVDGGRPYDVAFALTPTAINQALSAATSQGALNVDFTPSMTPQEAFYLAAIFSPLPDLRVRLQTTVPPVLNGELVCEPGIALPKLQLKNARVVIETNTVEYGVVPLMQIAIDIEAGLRLQPVEMAGGQVGLGFQLVTGPSCGVTSVEATVLSNPTAYADSLFEAFVETKATEAGLGSALPPLPLAELVRLEGLGSGTVTLGFDVVELAYAGTSVAVYLDLLVNGEGGTDDPLVIIESDFDGSGLNLWSYTLGSLENPGSGGAGGGDPGDGYLLGDPNTESATSYFVAPQKFMGDWTGYDSLELALQSSGGSYYTSGHSYRGDVYLANGEMTAQYAFGRRPASSWDRFSVPLEGGGAWTLGGGATSLADVLRNVTEFQVRGEYGVGSDEAALDDVQLVVR